MDPRLTHIVTRSGDDGTTGLADGSRVPKPHPRVEALGAVDELNSQLGLLRAETLPADVDGCLGAVQNRLFDLGSVLAGGGGAWDEAPLAGLEAACERFRQELPPLEEFILPGGTRAAALAQVARTVCRRAERRVAVLGEETLPLLRYLNRLSDLLFILARVLNRRAGRDEPLWRPGHAEDTPC